MADLDQWRNFGMVEGGVGLGYQAGQHVGRNIVADKRQHDRLGGLGIGQGCAYGRRQGGPDLGHIQAAIRSQAGKQGVGETEAGRLATA